VLPPADALTKLHLPDGFKATLFAAEPDVRQPIAMCSDERGRLWIAENYTYSDGKERFDLNLRDRILILEDADHDGKFDKRTVFTDEIQMLTSIERGFGGVWAVCPPNLVFIPMDGDKPAGPAKVILDGFSTTAASRHTFANGLKWGPDGWLYGRVGISSTSWIDVPGVPKEKRQPTAGGLWRYHPVTKVFEPLSPRHDPTPGAPIGPRTTSCCSSIPSSAMAGRAFMARTSSACTARTLTPSCTNSSTSRPTTITGTPARSANDADRRSWRRG
jgi:hypothetical protein